MALDSEGLTLSPATVPIGEGPPTREQLLVHYPPKFTWQQLRVFINSGDLGLLKRDRSLQKRYDTWAVGIRAEYGSMVNYLLTYRLQWGRTDSLSKLRSRLNIPTETNGPPQSHLSTSTPTVPPGAPTYFTADISPKLISIIQNDWPYSIPMKIEHTLIWTVVDIMPPNIPEPLRPRIHQDGLWGFSGYSRDSPPPSPSLLPECLPALADWGVTEDKLVRSPKGTKEEEQIVRNAGQEIQTFIERRWNEREWETAWFVNPPRLQSVPGLAHIHVFARYKNDGEQAEWDERS